MKTRNYTISDLEMLPDDDGNRYEIIDGELYVSKSPENEHQDVCTTIAALLLWWSNQTYLGGPILGPGLIFAEDNSVIPDVVWMSHTTRDASVGPDNRFHLAPELVIEVLSPGNINKRRDREEKLNLYSRRGVLEYWIANWQERFIDIYRREEETLKWVSRLYEGDTLQSPHLPGFHCQVKQVFARPGKPIR